MVVGYFALIDHFDKNEYDTSCQKMLDGLVYQKISEARQLLIGF